MLTPGDFKARWRARSGSGSERALYQEHFRDLREMLGQGGGGGADRETPAYVFEQPVVKADGGQGFADVWVPGRFAMEYKREGRDLRAAYAQLLAYKDALGNPLLLVVSDLRRIVVHRNFPNTPADPIEIGIDEIDSEANLQTLTWLFTDPEQLHPGVTRERVTEQAAARFGAIAAELTARGHDPARVAHLLVQLLFCLFAEDAGVLPRGLFKKMLEFGARHPDQFDVQLRALLEAMRTGGFFNMEPIPVVNGGLFAVVDPLTLTRAELTELAEAAGLDWSAVEPAIFGTLFERSLDPGSRAQLGAHYTGRADIERVVEPVVMTPLRRRWVEVQAETAPLVERIAAAATPQQRRNRQGDLARALLAFREELAAVTVLDPACGSGNFLYVALELLLGLDREVIGYGTAAGLSGMTPMIGPGQLRGLEINPYARELAQVVIWIGYLQWMIGNGFGWKEPVLAALETIELRDALLDRSDPANPVEAAWPAADYIIGNPPFLGGNRIRGELGDAYLEDLFKVYAGRIPKFADLVTYFFEKARGQIEVGSTRRIGLLATNSIRGGVNRVVLDRIKATGDIFTAWEDQPWVLEGAAVRISIIGFDDGREQIKNLNGQIVPTINADLTSTLDMTSASRLDENLGLAYMGTSKKGPFEITPDVAEAFLRLPVNPNGRTNSDVVKPWFNGKALNAGHVAEWIIDFGATMSLEAASLYEAPFEHVRRTVKPIRDTNNRDAYRVRWWLLGEPRPALRTALAGKHRYLATTIHSKYRLFSWVETQIVPDQALIVFAREDDYFFGVLQSRAHEVWSLRMGTSLEDRPRYTPTTCFETFPLPWPPGREPVEAGQAGAGLVAGIGEAARLLDARRTAWLNPPDASEADLKKRTLTALYNERPTWLVNAHASLDRAVWAAYGWDGEPGATTDEEVLERLLGLNGARASTGPGRIAHGTARG